MTKINSFLITKNSFCGTQPRNEEELPFCFLEKLLVLDYNLQHLVYRDNKNAISTMSQTVRATESGRTFDDFFIIKEPQSTVLQTCIHPMDLQIAIFHCADDFIRQYILTKLSTCQFALPLLVPNPSSKHEFEFPLWSLTQLRRSWKEVEKIGWEKEIKDYNNQLISYHRIHTICFVRFGNYVTTSKSKILNLLLSKGKHDHFFHHHSLEDNNRCILRDGLVEICWFHPGGRASDRFESCIAFTNLHGNAELHERQARFLLEVSSISVIILSTSFDKMNCSLLQDFFKSPKPVIFLFESVENIVDENSDHKVRIGIKNLNKIELADKIAATLKMLLKNSNSPSSLISWSTIAKKHNFTVDEDQRACQGAREKVNSLMDILQKVKISEIKDKLLPLQRNLWHNWCKKDRELYKLREKGNRSIQQYKNEIEEEKQKIRCEQYEKVIVLNDLMKVLLESVQSHLENHTEFYFLQELAISMDLLTTTQLETLNQRCRSLRTHVQTGKQEFSKRDSLRYWESELEAVSQEISDTTLGIEHLLREVGQIYEALAETSQANTLFLSLPQMVADLMLSGVPIELVDGDASYVPLKWVEAVFDKISEKIGDKRFFVLSVLGLKNSGKSTLLNTIFKTHFNLNAGKCTRGVYMQLLKVEEMLREELGFDYVLVVDTEGLQASEIIHKAHNKENELATFVIGIGDLTLINIMGEDLSGIQDILQIAVHAFLRMKQVKLSPRCLFIHQNTEEIINTNHSMKRLHKKLNQMTLAAAELEQRLDIQYFSDVIKFDINTHIRYFAHLWEGAPPMAPPNPSYSHNVQELKSWILMHAKEEARENILKISVLKIRIRNLWKAIINENFIFGFKNTQEIMALNKLETVYNSYTWKLRIHVLNLQNQIISKIQNKEIEDFKSLIENQVVEKHDAIKQELKRYFLENRDREILAQWQERFEGRLKNLKRECIKETIDKCENLIRVKEIQDFMEKHEGELRNKLSKINSWLAVSFEGKELHDEELRDKFNKIWSENIISLLPKFPSAKSPDVDIDLENIFLEYFKQHPNIVNKIVYRDSKKPFSINFSKHVITSQNYEVYGPSLTEFEKNLVSETTTKIKTLVGNKIREKQNDGYSSSYFHEILQVIHNETESASHRVRFIFTNEYKIQLALELFKDSASIFKRICIANDPEQYVRSEKDKFFTDFKLSYKKCQETD